VRVSASGEGEKTPLHFEPGIGPHFFRCQFVFLLPVEAVGTFEIAHLALKIRQASESAPRWFGLHCPNVTCLRLPVASVLKIQIGAEQARFDAAVGGRERLKSWLYI